MGTALVMAFLFGIVGLTAEIRHETSGWYSRYDQNTKSRERTIKVDKFICYALVVCFLGLAIYMAML